MNTVFNIYMVFAWIFICSSDFTYRGYKKVQLKSVSVINLQLFWWTINYSVINVTLQFTSLFWWRIASTCILFTAFHLLLLVSSLLWVIFFCSNLLSPSCNVGPKWEKTCYFGKNLNFFTQHARHHTQPCCPSTLSLSKQSGVTARTNFSSRVLVLPAKERFSFKVYVFSKECLILVEGKQKNTLHFYRYTPL